MNFASSPTTFFGHSIPLQSGTNSPGTFHVALQVPRTGEECDRMLEKARPRMRISEVRSLFARELARFLGAGSGVWTSVRREALQGLLVSAGEDAIDPVLSVVVRNPRAEITDAAETVLTEIGRQSSGLLQQLVARLESSSSPLTRAALIRSLAHVGRPIARTQIEAALNDDDTDVRDAAAIALGQLGAREAKAALQRRLGREREPLVLESLRTAIEELETA